MVLKKHLFYRSLDHDRKCHRTALPSEREGKCLILLAPLLAINAYGLCAMRALLGTAVAPISERILPAERGALSLSLCLSLFWQCTTSRYR
jgi:hypothetical protein